MLIKINDKYYLAKDNLNWFLQEKRIKESGENVGQEYYVTVGAYSSLVHLFESLSGRNIKSDDKDFLSIQEIAKELKEFNSFLKKEVGSIKRKILDSGEGREV